MSIALFMKQAQDEDKFGYEFIAGIDNRVAAMNASQLRGLYEHLKLTARASNNEMWKGANLKIISHLEGLMLEKEAVIEKERIKQEEQEATERNKIRMRKIRAQQNASALDIIERQSRERAEKIVREEECQRQVQERTQMMVAIIQADVRKERVWRRTAACYIVSIVAVCFVAITFLAALSTIIIAVGVSLLTVGGAAVAYRYHLKTIILPLVVSKQDIENQIDAREEELLEVALFEKRAKDRQYKEAVAAEKVERKKRLKAEKEKKIWEAEDAERRRVAQEAALEELSNSATSMADLMSGGGASVQRKTLGAFTPYVDDGSTIASAPMSRMGTLASILELDKAAMEITFTLVELTNTALSIAPGDQWAASIEVRDAAWGATPQEEKHEGHRQTRAEESVLWSAACVRTTATSMDFATEELSREWRLVAGCRQKIVLSIARNTDAAHESPNAAAGDKRSAHSSNDDAGLMGVFEAYQEDFYVASASGQPGQRCLRGVLLSAAYARMAEVAVHFGTASWDDSDREDSVDFGPAADLAILQPPIVADGK